MGLFVVALACRCWHRKISSGTSLVALNRVYTIVVVSVWFSANNEQSKVIRTVERGILVYIYKH